MLLLAFLIGVFYATYNLFVWEHISLTMEDESNKSMNPLENNEEVSSKRKNSEKHTGKHRKVAKISGCSSTQICFEDACSNDTVDNVLEDMEEEIDHVLEQTHYKNKLTPTKVKNILRVCYN